MRTELCDLFGASDARDRLRVHNPLHVGADFARNLGDAAARFELCEFTTADFDGVALWIEEEGSTVVRMVG